jgi:hypothetical protein
VHGGVAKRILLVFLRVLLRVLRASVVRIPFCSRSPFARAAGNRDAGRGQAA